MQKGGQALSHRVNHRMCRGLCAGAHMQDRNTFREGGDGQPEPEHMLGTAQPGAEFVQLEVGEMEMEEEALVQGVRVLARTRQPGGNGGLPVAEDALGGGRVQPFGQCMTSSPRTLCVYATACPSKQAAKMRFPRPLNGIYSSRRSIAFPQRGRIPQWRLNG
jgi:hypothetical protein